MPKRKARPADIADQSPKSKLRKKEPSRNQPKHGGSGKKKASPSASSGEQIPQKKGLMGVSSNWKTLSKSLGISCERKQSQTGSGDDNSRQRGAEGEKRAGGERGVDKKKDIWFDDIPLECVDGDLVPKPKTSETHSLPLVTGSNTSAGRQVGLDCEMVGTGPDGSYSMVARVCLVNHHGNVLLDTFVAPMDRVTDYRTAVSGVCAKDLRGAPEFKVVQKQVSDLLKDRILVGHSVQNDLKALLLSHPKRDIRDTAKYRPLKKIAQTRYPSLKKLAKEILGLDIQGNEHNPVEDARVAMKLYQLHRRDWEASVKERLTRREIRERRAERKWREESTKRGLQQKSTSQTRRRRVVEKPFNIMLHTDR